MRAQLKCVVEEKSGEEVDIRPMRFFVRFFLFLVVEKAKGGTKRRKRNFDVYLSSVCVIHVSTNKDFREILTTKHEYIYPPICDGQDVTMHIYILCLR